MLSRGQVNSRMPGFAMKGTGTALGVAVLLTSAISLPGTANAAPLFPNSVQSAQATQGGTNGDADSGDVIVDTDRSGSTTGSTTDRTTTSPSARTAGARFSCQATSGQYVVMYHPESQPGQSYAWANPTSMGGGWTPERRCNEISRRLESYRPDGLLEMKTAVENGYNTVCVTTQNVSSCRIVMTVPAGQDPIATRDSVFQNLSVADAGRQTQAVNTFVGGREAGIVGQIGQVLNSLPGLGNRARSSDAINLRPFLDRADGGTAQNLRGGISNRPARLNPNKFR